MKFTRETAREFGRKGNEVRWSPKPPPPDPPPVPNPNTAIPVDDFSARKVARVRTQIERVENLLTDAVEPQAVDRFAAALARLYEIERILSGRPLPGSRRPEKDKPTRTFTPGAWLDLSAPAPPAQVDAPAPQVALPCPSCASDTTPPAISPPDLTGPPAT